MAEEVQPTVEKEEDRHIDLAPEATADQPWSRLREVIDLPGGKRTKFVETDKAFEAFRIYRDMPWREKDPKMRQIKHVAAELKKSVQLIHRWAQKYDWHERAAAFDVHIDKQLQKETIWQIRVMRKRQAKYGRQMQAKGMMALLQTPTMDISPSAAITMVKEGANLERLGLGEPTENVQQSGTVEYRYIEVVEQRRDPQEMEALDE